MGRFKGFSADNLHLIPIPGSFFEELLPVIESVEELKVLLYSFWRLSQQEETFQFLRTSDFLDDSEFMEGLGKRIGSPDATLAWALNEGVQRGTLLTSEIQFQTKKEPIYIINSARGRAAMKAIQQGHWNPAAGDPEPGPQKFAQPNVFKIYEENIGPLTPMIAEALKEAETVYPAGWIEEAIRIAVENNVRRWRYAEAILMNWQEKGKDERKVRGDSEKDRRRYVSGEFSEFVEH
jgi:DnaD/phage-associated family protein